MANRSDTEWPLPKFFFEVELEGGEPIPFQEVSGMDIESQPQEYRAGTAKAFSTVKMPGMMKAANVTLRKGIAARGSGFVDWYTRVQMNTIARKRVTIRLLDETGAATMVWVLANAFPIKVRTGDLPADGTDVPIEEMELSHEGMTIENGRDP